MTISLSAPDPDMLGRLFQEKLKAAFRKQNWFSKQGDEDKFAELLDRVWRDSLSRVCTNLRKIGLLLNDILSAAGPITGEVNAFDLTLIEAVRRFYPDVYRLVRKNPLFLTIASSNWRQGRYFADEEKKKGTERFLEELKETVSKSNEPSAIQAMLSWIFPEYVRAQGEKLTTYALSRRTDGEIAEAEKRICAPDYFPIYFRAAVPEEMFSDAELRRLIRDLTEAENESAVEDIFSGVLKAIPLKHAKREDLLRKLGRAIDQLDDVVAERLAYAASSRAIDYSYDTFNIGEAARALNIVFIAAQKLSTTPRVQELLLGAMARAADDTFAVRLLQYTKDRDRNEILTNFSNVNVEDIGRAFVDRMRRRYNVANLQTASIAQGDWRAFHVWVESSDEDTAREQEFWRGFIGTSRKRLAQSINFIYPGGNVSWEEDPTPIVTKMFPVDEIARLIDELPEEPLDEVESGGITRFRDLLAGKYFKLGQR